MNKIVKTKKTIKLNNTAKTKKIHVPPTRNSKPIELRDREFRVNAVASHLSHNPGQTVNNLIVTKYNSPIDKIIKSFTDLNYKLDLSIQRKSLDIPALNNIKPTGVKPYFFNELIQNEKKFRKLYVDKKIVWPKYYTATKYQRDILSFIASGFARSVNKYMNEKYKNYNVSNAFVKLWEIYNTFDWLLPKDKPITKMFHMAEAPGQWINTTTTYFKQHMPKTAKYEWYGNSLNADHPKIKGVIDAFKNDYGLIKKYKDRWIWGADETGDITSTENIRWYGKYISEKMGSVDIVTGDAGLSLENPSLAFLQKLELAQMVMVACTSTPGSACIIKHFLPYIPKINESSYASGFFISFMYMYQLMFKEFHMFKPLSSNPGSGEFYFVANGFLGLPEEIKNKLLEALDNFKVNQPIFERKDIPLLFIKKVLGFINALLSRNIDSASVELDAIRCIRKKPTLLDCNYYLGPEFKKLKEQDIDAWIKKYKLNVKS